MTDFYAQLEEQLIAAGRRRGTQGRAARAVAGRGRVLGATTALAAAVIAGGAFALPAVLTSSPTSATPAAPATKPAPALAGQDLSGIRIVVLNATSASSAARTVANALAGRGAVISAVRNGPQKAGSISVFSLRGAQSRSRRVASALAVPLLGPFDGTGYAKKAGALPRGSRQADAVVVVGTSRTSVQATPLPAQAPAAAPPAVPIGSVLRGLAVAVLNGTPRPGSGGPVAKRLARYGAVIRTTANAPDQSVGRTVVLYATARDRIEAIGVSGVLGGTVVRRAPRDVVLLAHGAGVIVVVGANGLVGPPVAVVTPATPKAPPATTPVAPVAPSRPGGYVPVTPAQPLPAPAATPASPLPAPAAPGPAPRPPTVTAVAPQP